MGKCSILSLLLVPCVWAQMSFPDGFDGGSMSIRDMESFDGPLAWGHKYIGGGAGEGDQLLSPEGMYPNHQEVKTDAVLPAYCEPPNPCPIGFSGHDGCLEDFENTAEFSQQYQGRQKCLCDEEHMFSCPNKPKEMDLDQGLQQYLQNAEEELHKTLVAKKFDRDVRGAPRKKRSMDSETKDEQLFDWLKGEKLVHHRAKKG